MRPPHRRNKGKSSARQGHKFLLSERPYIPFIFSQDVEEMRMSVGVEVGTALQKVPAHMPVVGTFGRSEIKLSAPNAIGPFVVSARVHRKLSSATLGTRREDKATLLEAKTGGSLSPYSLIAHAAAEKGESFFRHLRYITPLITPFILLQQPSWIRCRVCCCARSKS